MPEGGADRAALLAAAEATWPPAEVARDGGIETGRGLGAGGRVSASRVVAPDWCEADLEAAVARHRAWGQPPLVRAWVDDTRLNVVLAAGGWQRFKPTAILSLPVAALTDRPVPAMTAFALWPPLAVQRELWAEGGIGPERQAVMERAPAPKAALMGRVKDRVAGSAFVAAHGPVAFLHAVEVTPALRRHGIGAALVRKAAQWAAGAGATTLALAVARENAGALALYRSLGFTEAVGYAYWRRG